MVATPLNQRDKFIGCKVLRYLSVVEDISCIFSLLTIHFSFLTLIVLFNKNITNALKECLKSGKLSDIKFI